MPDEMAESLLSATGGNGSGCSDWRTNMLRDLRKYISEGCIIDLSPSLRPDELIACARRARVAALIPQRILNDLRTVHPDIPHETKCRYLMLYIGKAVIAAERLGQDRFPSVIELLYKFLSPEQIKLRLLRSVDNLDERMKPAEVFEVCIRPETIFNESHLNRLYEILNICNHLWIKIGMALNFKYDDLMNIKIDNKQASECLLKLLHAWLSEVHIHVKPPTFGALEEVLSSELVGRRRMVDDIAEMLRSTATPSNRDIIDNVSMDGNFLTYTSCDVTVQESSNDTVVLIEVRLKCQDPQIIEYKWSKDGVILKPSDSLILDSSILSIRIADICAEGNYQCRCIFGNRVIESDPIELKVETLLCKYRPRLIARYEKKPEVKQDTWHRVEQKTYINLAVIGDESARLSDKCYHQTIRGDADDVFSSSKSSIEYQEAFRDIMYGDIVIVVGRPGSGKTTLVHKLSKDWADGKVLGKYKVLFIICLRGFHNDPNVTLQDLIKCYFKKPQDINIICDYIEEHEGLGVCFILDGLDEYQPESEEPKFICQLIERDVLPCATVIVASRPAAVAMYNKVAKRQVEVLGFFKQEIDKYIESYEFSSDSQMSNLKNYLLHHPSIKYMCYLPIQIAMICFLFDECKDALPNTETELYEEFTKHTIFRARHNSKTLKCRVHKLEDLESEEKFILKDICELAYGMTISIKQVATKSSLGDLELRETLGLISVDEKATICGFQNLYSFFHLTFQEFLAAYHISKQTIEEQLAIIQSHGYKEHMYMVFKFYCGLAQFKKDDIRFKTLIEVAKFSTVHTLQCCYESQQPDTCELAVVDKNIICIDESFKTPSDYTCLGYVVQNATRNPVRILEYDGNEIDEVVINSECVKAFEAAVNSGKTHIPIEMLMYFGNFDDLRFDESVLNLMKACPNCYLFCSNIWDPDVIDFMSHSNMEVICFEDTLPSEAIYMENFCKFRIFSCEGSNSTSPTTALDSVYCHPFSSYTNMTFTRAEILLISYHFKWNQLCLHNNDFEHDTCLCTHLNMFNCNLNDEKAALLAEGLQYNSSVEVLKLVANDIGDEGAVAIAGAIKGCYNLNYLDLRFNKIGDEGAIKLVNINKDNFNLFLFGNPISDSFIAKLDRENISKCFYTLDISDCIGDKGFARLYDLINELSPPLSTLRTLHTLHLQSCSNSVEGTKHVINMLPMFTGLYSVSFIDMKITADSMKLISNYILWDNVHILNLSYNSIGPEGTTYLCQSLQEISHQILTLNLGHNIIGVEGALAVAKCLQVSQSLCELDLSYNNIQDTGTKAICESLKNNGKLQTLCLSSNSIGVQGCLAIASLLKQDVITNFSSLNLSHNSIGPEGTAYLCQSLQGISHQILTLNLGHNIIGVEGALAVAKCLQASKSLCELDLSNNDIQDTGTKAICESLKNNGKLQTLCLSSNSIGVQGCLAIASLLRPEVITSFSSLNLSHNSIGPEGTAYLCQSLQGISQQILTLNLGHNNIEVEGALAVAKCLQASQSLCELDLSYNNIQDTGTKAICESLKNNDKLQTLCLASNSIGVQGCLAIASLLKQDVITSFSSLNFSHNSIGPEGTAYLCQSLQRISQQILTLNLGHNIIGVEGALAVAKCLQASQSLCELDLSYNNIQDTGTEAICESLKNNGKLQTLCLASNSIGVQGCLAIASLLEQQVITSFLSLNLSHNSIGPQGMTYLCQSLQGISHQILTLNLGHNNIGVEGALAVAKRLQARQSLCELDLSHNNIQDTGTEAICESLKNNSKLQTICLASNGISAQGCLAIASLLEEHGENVVTLDLSHNELRDVGAVCLSRGLRWCNNLRFFDISNNYIGDLGVEAIRRNLRCNITEISVACNYIEDNGAKALASCLRTCNQLTLLNLSDNRIGDRGASNLGIALQQCSRLCTIRLNYNLLSGLGAIHLAEGLQCCQNLETLELGHNFIWYSDIQCIARTLQQCTRLKRVFIPNDWVYLDDDTKNEEMLKPHEYLPNCAFIMCGIY